MTRRAAAVSRATGLAGVVGFGVLASVVCASGELPPREAVAAIAAAVIGVGVPALLAPHGWRRRAAELALLPPAWALAMLGDPLMRRMLVPPLLVAAAAAAVAAAWGRCPAGRRPLLVAALGVAGRAAVASGDWAGAVAVALAVAAAAIVPAAIVRRWPAGGVLAALVFGTAPLERWPALSAVIVVGGLASVLGGRPRPRGWWPWGWLPAVAGCGLVLASVTPFGGLPGAASPVSPLAVVAAVGCLVATAWLPPAAAGALWFLLPVAAGPPIAPPPDHAAFRLEAGDLSAVLWPARGPSYGIDVALVHGAGVAQGTPVARLETGLGVTVLRAGVDAVEAAHQRSDVRRVAAHGLPDRPVWRPAVIGGTEAWRVAGRTTVPVTDGERPVLTRDPELDPTVVVVIETGGPAAPTAPRSWGLSAWLIAAAAAVGLIQLLAGTWRRPVAVPPWAVLVAAACLSRLPVEPLRLAGERHAIDLAMVALVLAWAPAMRRWLERGRVAVAAAAMLVPLAVATPRLTPPMYGDEPFHLRVMQSVVEDRDLDLADDVSDRPAERLYQRDGLLYHSPALGVLLAPFYAVAGRTGALAALALAAAAAAALIARRSRQLGVPRSRAAPVAGLLVVTYPLATFSTQIWPEVPGMLAVAAVLVLGAGGRVGVVAVAAAAIAIKTRLGLVVVPAAAAAWWRRGGRARWVGLGAVASALVAGLGVGWLTMGHPFGFYRRLTHLLPSDPVQPLKVVTGLVVDAAGGFAITAPVWLLGAAGLALLWRRGGSGERGLVVGLAATVAALLHSPEWYGGGAPPARYLVPALPAVALGLGLVLTRPVRWRGWVWLLAVPSFATWWVLVTRPHLSLNPGDGSWWLTTALARRLGADTRWLTPSLLVPDTAAWVAVATVVAAVVVGRGLARWSRTVSRMAVGVWLVAAAVVFAAVVVRTDRVVELESAQIRRWGGAPQPPVGTTSRFDVPNGWRLGDGDRVEIPLHLGADSGVVLEGWLAGPAKAGVTLHVRWDDGPSAALSVRGRRRDRRLQLPTPPGPGRHRLGLRLEAPRGGVAILDRVVVEE